MEKYFSKKSFYFFLALLVFVQEAKGRSYQLESKRRDVANAGYQTQNDDKKPAAMKENEEKSVFWNDEYCENCLFPDSLSADSMEETRGKRNIVSALIGGATILAMTGSLTTEIVAYVSKCCAFDKRTCDADEKFKEGQQRLISLSNRVNILWAQVENRYTNTARLNFKMKELWIRIQVVDDTITQMIELIDPSVFANLNATQEALKAKILENRIEYRNFELLKAEYNSLFNNVGKVIANYYGFISMPVLTLSQRWVINKLAAAGPGAFDNYKAYNPKKYILKSAAWANNKWKALSAKYPRATKIFSNAASFVAAGVSIAFEGLKIYQTVSRCRDFGDDVTKKLGVMDELMVNTSRLYDEVDKQYTNVRTNYISMKSQLERSELEVFLSNVKQIVANVSVRFPEKLTAVKAIDDFLDKITAADTAETDALITGLNKALHSVANILSCYQSQLVAVKYIVETCKKGKKSTLDELYQEATQYVNECSVVDYITRASTVGMAKKTLDSTIGVSSKCLYNDKELKASVCTFKEYGYDLATIAVIAGVPKNALGPILQNC